MSDDLSDLLRLSDRMLRGLDATQRLITENSQHNMEFATDLAAMKEVVRRLVEDVARLVRTALDGNGNSMMSQITSLRQDVDHLEGELKELLEHADKRQDRWWTVLGQLAVGFVLGALGWALKAHLP